MYLASRLQDDFSSCLDMNARILSTPYVRIQDNIPFGLYRQCPVNIQKAFHCHIPASPYSHIASDSASAFQNHIPS